MTRKLELRPLATIIVAASLAAGCAANLPAAEQSASLEAAIAAARDAGAARYASRELALALDKQQLSKRFIAAKDSKPAFWLVEQAQVDAELATMKAMSARALDKAALATQELRASNIRVARTAN